MGITRREFLAALGVAVLPGCAGPLRDVHEDTKRLSPSYNQTLLAANAEKARCAATVAASLPLLHEIYQQAIKNVPLSNTGRSLWRDSTTSSLESAYRRLQREAGDSETGIEILGYASHLLGRMGEAENRLPPLGETRVGGYKLSQLRQELDRAFDVISTGTFGKMKYDMGNFSDDPRYYVCNARNAEAAYGKISAAARAFLQQQPVRSDSPAPQQETPAEQFNFTPAQKRTPCSASSASSSQFIMRKNADAAPAKPGCGLR